MSKTKEELERDYEVLKFKLEGLEEKLDQHIGRWSCHELSG